MHAMQQRVNQILKISFSLTRCYISSFSRQFWRDRLLQTFYSFRSMILRWIFIYSFIVEKYLITTNNDKGQSN